MVEIRKEPPPSLERYRDFAKKELAAHGEMAIGYATWGDLQLAAPYRQTHELLGDVKYNLGFSGGYRYPDNVDVLDDEAQFQQAQHAEMLAKDLLAQRGWNGVDLLIIGSSSSKPEITKVASKLLREEGIGVGETKFYGIACASAINGFLDAASDPNLLNARVASIGIESLSGSWVDPNNHLVRLLFGNGAGGIAFVSGKDVKHIMGYTNIEQDVKGVIRIPTAYELPPPEERLPILPRYRVNQQDGHDYFAVSKNGVFLAMPKLEEGAYVQIDGEANFKYFVFRGPKPIVEVLTQFHKEYGNDAPRNPAVVHHPSLPVHQWMGLRASKQLPKNIPFDSSRDMPWMMGEVNINNISSGDIFVVWTEMAKKGLLVPNAYTPIIHQGIGSGIGMDMVQVLK